MANKFNYTFALRGQITVNEEHEEGIAYGWVKVALENLTLTLPEQLRRQVEHFEITSVALDLIKSREESGDYSTICPYCGYDGITVIEVTLVQGEIVLQPMVPLESDGFAFVPPDPDMKDTSTQDERVRCNSCGREFGLDELM